MYGQCDARPTVAFPAADRHRPLTGTNAAWWQRQKYVNKVSL